MADSKVQAVKKIVRTDRKLSAKERRKRMDGASFWTDYDLPEDYWIDPETGFRVGEKSAPAGTVTIDTDRFGNNPYIIPTRTAWKLGKWKNDKDSTSEDYYTWVVNAEGTPGNYAFRQYILPQDIATSGVVPPHPRDWPKEYLPGFLGGGKKKPQNSYFSTGQPAKKAAPPKPSLPLGIRFRCPGCGHWYREGDLKGHAQCCPKSEGGVAMWAIACECGDCKGLDDTSKPKPGFPLATGTIPEVVKGEEKEVGNGPLPTEDAVSQGG